LVWLSLPEGDAFNIAIYDVQGSMVQVMQHIRSGHKINVSKFQKGVYVVRVSNNQIFTTIKLLSPLRKVHPHRITCKSR
jgi:hypothetical protein